MQRRKFLQSSIAAATGIAAGINPANATQKFPPQKEIYEWREYDMKWGSDQSQLEKYFQSALIPAFNKYGVKTVGVFKEWGKSEPPRIYVIIPYASMDDYLTVNAKVKADADYINNSTAYNSLPAAKPIYTRFTTTLMLAFDGMPKLIPAKGDSRFFELRTYEGYSEDAVRRKIKMFNDGEFPIFYRSKLNPVFFGEVIAGDKMPRLTYMITFNSMEDHDKAWVAFLADPDWKKMAADPQYANTVSNIIKTFLVPTSYSQV